MDRPSDQRYARLGYLLVILVTLWDVGSSTFFGLTALLAPGRIVDGATSQNLFAGYFAARALPWAFALLAALTTRSFRALAGLLALGSMIQVFDAVLGVSFHRAPLFVIAPALKAIAMLAGAVWLTKRHPKPAGPQ